MYVVPLNILCCCRLSVEIDRLELLVLALTMHARRLYLLLLVVLISILMRRRLVVVMRYQKLQIALQDFKP
jgi:hypothetical protein